MRSKKGSVRKGRVVRSESFRGREKGFECGGWDDWVGAKEGGWVAGEGDGWFHVKR